ncbi:MAG: xanthine dehydrogenase family protein subunit M [Candidatus Marinimicrobia bacterium]|nr:xanthine dehydrogenase family protein subunit M [Candidatus Neomarinimicrobiota bacterium]
MIPGTFEYHKPSTLDEAVALLASLGDDAKVLSGGQSLIPMMKFRLAEPANLVDINGLEGLDYIREADGYLTIGALTREAELDRSDLIKSKYPIIHDTAHVIADPQVRNLATIGGNLAHGDPANDHPATMVALGAEVVVFGPNGSRTIGIDDFFLGPLATALKANEILTEIRIPVPPANSGGAYIKFERKVGDFAIAAVAATVTLDGSGKCVKAGIGLTNVGPTPVRAKAAEEALIGNPLTDDNIATAGRLASEASQPVGDQRGSEEYKRAVVEVLTKRALHKAKARAEGGK